MGRQAYELAFTLLSSTAVKALAVALGLVLLPGCSDEASPPRSDAADAVHLLVDADGAKVCTQVFASTGEMMADRHCVLPHLDEPGTVMFVRSFIDHQHRYDVFLRTADTEIEPLFESHAVVVDGAFIVWSAELPRFRVSWNGQSAECAVQNVILTCSTE